MGLIKIENLHPQEIDKILGSLWTAIERDTKGIKELNPEEVEVRNEYLDTLFGTTSLAFRISLDTLSQLEQDYLNLLAKKEGKQ
jgi:hypothetical protein